MIFSRSVECNVSLSNEEKRWVVIGVCLTKVLTPVLRSVIDNEMQKWHQDLCKPPVKIHISPHKIKLHPSTIDLNYKNINNNHVHKSLRSYDYAVKDPLSLAKLFVKPFMCNFTGFDQTMDTSTALSVMAEAAPFIKVGADDDAKNLRSDIRNEWAHCNFATWSEEKLDEGIQSMEKLLKRLNIPPGDKQKVCNELNSWKDKGNFCDSLKYPGPGNPLRLCSCI